MKGDYKCCCHQGANVGPKMQEMAAQTEKWEMGQTACANAPVAKVWELMKDFVNLQRWHPAVVSSTLSSGEPQKPGVVRYVVTKSGDTFYEQLTYLDSENYRFAYIALENTFGLVDYQAQISLKQGKEPGTTVMTWVGNMSPSPQKTKEQIHSILGRGFIQASEGITEMLSTS